MKPGIVISIISWTHSVGFGFMMFIAIHITTKFLNATWLRKQTCRLCINLIHIVGVFRSQIKLLLHYDAVCCRYRFISFPLSSKIQLDAVHCHSVLRQAGLHQWELGTKKVCLYLLVVTLSFYANLWFTKTNLLWSRYKIIFKIKLLTL